MSDFEKCVMTRVYSCCGFRCQAQLQLMCSVKSTQLNEFLRHWRKKWGEAGKLLSQLPVTQAFAEQVYPPKFVGVFGDQKIFGMVDGKDWPCDTARKNTILQRALRSHKISGSAFRNITWITPHGLTYAHSPLFLGRISERRIMELMEIVHQLWPRGWASLADRGFDGLEVLFQFMNEIVCPHFKNGFKQFTRLQNVRDQKVAPLRSPSEVFNSRMTNDKITSGTIRRGLFASISDLVHWAHARGNLDKPLTEPAGYDPDYFEDNPARWHKAGKGEL